MNSNESNIRLHDGIMKRVSFKVAKALKEAGYPQDRTNSHYTNCGELVYYGIAGETGFDAPTYLEVWLWLWREKNISIDWKDGYIYVNGEEIGCFNEPEEAIIAAIEYLVDNDLIK